MNKVSSSLHLVDAAPPRADVEDCFTDLHPEKYWKGEKHFRILFSANRLVRFVVMDVDLCDSYGGGGGGATGHHHDGEAEEEDEHDQMYNKYALADVVVARESDVGVSDETFHCTTHLGNILGIGDHVMGYDLVSSVLTGGDEWAINNSFNSSFNMPDVVLVKKTKPPAEDGQDQQSANSKASSKAEKKKKKARSSASKKREKRNRKQEKKVKDLAHTMSRMGFGGDVGDGGGGGGDDHDHDDDGMSEDIWDVEREAFEQDLKVDRELAADFRSIAEKRLDAVPEMKPSAQIETQKGSRIEKGAKP